MIEMELLQSDDNTGAAGRSDSAPAGGVLPALLRGRTLSGQNGQHEKFLMLA
jgi:hypothetical protein